MRELAGKGRVHRGRPEFVSATGVGKREEQQSAIAARSAAVPGSGHHESCEMGYVENAAEEFIGDEGGGV